MSLLLAQLSPAADTALRVSFTNPTFEPYRGDGVQQFILHARRIGAGASNPVVRVDLYESGTLLGTAIPPTAVSSTTGQRIAGSWDASLLSDATGANVEAYVYGASAYDGRVEVGALRWLAALSQIVVVGGSTTPLSLDVVLSITPTGIKQARLPRQATLSLTPSVVKQVSKPLATRINFTPAILKQVLKILAVVLSLAVALTK